jgi:hypothetical protein
MAVNFNEIPVGVNLSVDNINSLTARSSELSRAFAGKIGYLQNTLGETRQRYSRDADEIISASEPSTRNVAKQFAKQQLAQRMTKFHATLVQSSEADRDAPLKLLAAHATEAAFLSTLCASPTQILGRVGLGDAKRTQYQLQLDGAGPVELETAARTAVATNDVVLAAAIVTVIDRRPPERRPFPAADLASRMYGDEHQKISSQLAAIQLAYKTASAANREFVRGKADALTNLSNSLAKGAIDQSSL